MLDGNTDWVALAIAAASNGCPDLGLAALASHRVTGAEGASHLAAPSDYPGLCCTQPDRHQAIGAGESRSLLACASKLFVNSAINSGRTRGVPCPFPRTATGQSGALPFQASPSVSQDRLGRYARAFARSSLFCRPTIAIANSWFNGCTGRVCPDLDRPHTAFLCERDHPLAGEFKTSQEGARDRHPAPPLPL